MQKRKKSLSLLLMLIMVMSFLPISSLTASAIDGVPYIDEYGQPQTANNVEELTGSVGIKTLNDGWYIAKGTITFSGTLTLFGDVHIILEDGCVMTVNGVGAPECEGMFVSSGNSAIYAQAADTGMLEVIGCDAPGTDGGDGIIVYNSNFSVNGGAINAQGGDGANAGSGIYVFSGSFVINNGNVTATKGSGVGGDGIYNLTGTTTINGGTVNGTVYRTVTFDSQGGSAIAPTGVANGSKATEPAAPAKLGYMFEGWYKTIGYTDQWFFASDIVTSNIVLYAKWGIQAGGKIAPTINVPPAATGIYKGSKLGASILSGGLATVPGGFSWTDSNITPTVTDYYSVLFTPADADTYNTANTGTKVTVLDRDALGAKLTEANNIKGQIGVGVGTNRYTQSDYDAYVAAINSAQAVYDKVADNNTQAQIDSATAALTAAIAALHFVPPPPPPQPPSGNNDSSVAYYSVTYETDGGSKINNSLVTYGVKITQPADPAKEGFVFNGWFVDKDFTTAFDFNKTITDNVTIYAKWVVDDNAENKENKEENEITMPFVDILKGDKYYDDIEYVYVNGIFNGVTETLFRPNDSMTRAMFVTALWRMDGCSPVMLPEMPFVDVNVSEYYSIALSWAWESGIVVGMGGGLFAPNETITREQAAVMLYRYALYLGMDVEVDEPEYAVFGDTPKVSEWAYNGVLYCVLNGIMENMSNGLFYPQNEVPRAEAASILHLFVVLQ